MRKTIKSLEVELLQLQSDKTYYQGEIKKLNNNLKLLEESFKTKQLQAVSQVLQSMASMMEAAAKAIIHSV